VIDDAELRKRLAEFVVNPQDDGIYWATKNSRSQGIILHAAPLDVGDTLDKLLYSDKESVVLTSATLSTDGNFKPLCSQGYAGAKRRRLPASNRPVVVRWRSSLHMRRLEHAPRQFGGQ